MISGNLREHLKERFEKPRGLVDLIIDPELILNLPHETEWREAIGNSKRGNLRHAAKTIGYLIITRTMLRFLAENPRSILYVDIPGRDWKLWDSLRSGAISRYRWY